MECDKGFIIGKTFFSLLDISVSLNFVLIKILLIKVYFLLNFDSHILALDMYLHVCILSYLILHRKILRLAQMTVINGIFG